MHRSMLHDFVTSRRGELIARTRAKVALRSSPKPTEIELTSGIPLFLDQLADALRSTTTPSPESTRSMKHGAATHGGELLKKGFTIAQVVHDYGDVCQAVTELAADVDERITTEEFHTLNRCLDNAIADAVTSYTEQHERRVADEETERSGAFAHELRNRLSAAMLGFSMLKNGTAPAGGSVAGVIERNLQRMKGLIDRSLVEVRVDAGNIQRERVLLRSIMEEAEVDGGLEAAAHGVSLSVSPVDSTIAVDVDPQILSATIANLLQNAFKFTAPGGHVALRISSVGDYVAIDIEDQCGGLPPGKAEELFGAFEQRGKNRKGLGLGLFISRKGIEACGGALHVRDLPGKGCVFTIDLPCVHGPGTP
jgi:signal transduction histidine kinase